jgi:endonuclease/exonuclease/phosphatase family metal-dependent hydrolase
MAKMFSGENKARLTIYSANMKWLCVLIFTFTLCSISFAIETFRVAAYNVETYLDQPTESRHFVKSAEAKAKVRESIEAMNPDVLALEEMGTTNALLELRAALKADGQDFPFWEHVSGADTNIHVAVLSKFPIVARRPHTNDDFLLDGRRFQVKRGFAEVDIQAATNFTFTLIAAHLKSKLATPNDDEAEERLAEARVLRGIIDEHFKANPNEKLIVLGDFNDVKNSDSTKEIHRARKIQAHRHAACRAQRRQRARRAAVFRAAQRGVDLFLRRGRHLRAHRLHSVESRDGARLGEGRDLHSHDSELGHRFRPPANRRGV